MRVLILGITGQDGSILAEQHLDNGWEVHGLYRHTSTPSLGRIELIKDRVTLHKGDILDVSSLLNTIDQVRPDVIYNEADQDHVGTSYSVPSYNMDVTAKGVLNLLQVVWKVNKGIKVFQPLSATIFGDAPAPQDEVTPLKPQSPYAIAKACAYHWCGYYRDVLGMYVATAIFYNHDSIKRTGDYLLHKVCKHAVLLGLKKTKEPLRLGDMGIPLDIGCAYEYMTAARTIMSLDKPDDFVIGTGKSKLIVEVVKEAFHIMGVPFNIDTVLGDPNNRRPGPQPKLVANYSKAKNVFGFAPLRNVIDIVHELVEHYKSRVNDD